MAHAGFVHLRVRSGFSLLQSTVRIEPLAAACRAAAMPAVAVTDDANLFGVMQLGAAAKKAGVQPIVGAMLPMEPPPAQGRPTGRAPAAEHLVLLVKDQTGYGNLLRLLSRAWVRAEAGSEVRVGTSTVTSPFASRPRKTRWVMTSLPESSLANSW